VEKHNEVKENQRLWVSFKDGVYDVTDFISSHPGGKDRIFQAGGKDLKEFWFQKEFRHHLRSPLALEVLEEMRIGTLHPDDIDWKMIRELESFHFPPNGALDAAGAGLRDQLQFSNQKIYDCIVVGSGLSGLKTAHTLVNSHQIPSDKILLLDAQDYIGGRVKQITEFIPGTKIDVGAEFLHGDNTELTKFAQETKQPLRKIFCWAHGDGGPLSAPVDGGYGLYFLQDTAGNGRLLRFDSRDEEFQRTNEILHHLSQLNPKDYSDFHSLDDYLRGQGLSSEMLEMANAGFSNTLCTSSKLLSLKRCIQWENLWHGESEVEKEKTDEKEQENESAAQKGAGGHVEEEEEHDFTFVNSFGCLIDHLKQDLQIELNSPVFRIDYTLPGAVPAGELMEKNHLPELIKLTTLQGTPYYAKSVVITSSPHVMKSSLMTFNPPLSHDLQEALDTTRMNSIVKVILKFSKLPWPKDLHGMIMANATPDHDFVLPEMWFRHVDEQTINSAEGDGAVCYVVGFMTTDYAEKILKLSHSEAISRVLKQMDTVFSHLEPQHMSGDPISSPSSSVSVPEATAVTTLPKPSEVFIGGTFWHWTPEHHPYIGGGYSSPVAGKATALCDRLAQPYGESQNIFFAGEATSLPGATAHAALESGVRAAQQVANHLKASN
jgi:monoamine oxidase